MDMSNKPVREHFLDQVDRLIDWVALAPKMEAISARTRSSLPLAWVRMLLLARWYGLSDGTLREACDDRLSFRRVIGLAEQADAAALSGAYPDGLPDAPAEVQDLVNAVNAQIAARGFTMKAAGNGDPVLAATAAEHARDNEQISDTTLFQPGEMAKLLREAEPLLARAGAQMHDRPPTTGPGKPQARSVRETKAVSGVIEWPWGATTELREHLNIGRQFGFCPFARELQPYGHVSRKHAELLVYGDGIWVRDLGSSNGTFVNDDEVPKGQAYLIDVDSRIRFGPNFVLLLKLRQ